VEELAGSDELRMDYELEPGAPSRTQHYCRHDAAAAELDATNPEL